MVPAVERRLHAGLDPRRRARRSAGARRGPPGAARRRTCRRASARTARPGRTARPTSTFTENAPHASMHPWVFDERSTHTSTIGGSSETDVNAFTVSPQTPVGDVAGAHDRHAGRVPGQDLAKVQRIDAHVTPLECTNGRAESRPGQPRRGERLDQQLVGRAEPVRVRAHPRAAQDHAVDDALEPGQLSAGLVRRPGHREVLDERQRDLGHGRQVALARTPSGGCRPGPPARASRAPARTSGWSRRTPAASPPPGGPGRRRGSTCTTRLVVTLTSDGSRPASAAPRSIAGRSTSAHVRGLVMGWPEMPSATRPAASAILGFTAAR